MFSFRKKIATLVSFTSVLHPKKSFLCVCFLQETRMAVTEAENPLLGEITCGTLLQKLQVIFRTAHLKTMVS